MRQLMTLRLEGRRRVIGALIFLLCAPGLARAATTENANKFLTELTDRVLLQLTKTGLPDVEQRKRFRGLFNEAFDLPEIGRFVLGRYWRRAEPAQRSEFLGAFEDMMLDRFLPLFSRYSGETLDIGATRAHRSDPDFVSVESRLRPLKGEPIRVDWRVRKRGEGYKIVDIVAEGISIAVTLRSEYASVLMRNGGDVDALSRVLREKAKGL